MQVVSFPMAMRSVLHFAIHGNMGIGIRLWLWFFTITIMGKNRRSNVLERKGKKKKKGNTNYHHPTQTAKTNSEISRMISMRQFLKKSSDDAQWKWRRNQASLSYAQVETDETGLLFSFDRPRGEKSNQCREPREQSRTESSAGDREIERTNEESKRS